MRHRKAGNRRDFLGRELGGPKYFFLSGAAGGLANVAQKGTTKGDIENRRHRFFFRGNPFRGLRKKSEYAKVVDLLVDAIKELNVPCAEPPAPAERHADAVDLLRSLLNKLESHGADAHAAAAAEHSATSESNKPALAAEFHADFTPAKLAPAQALFERPRGGPGRARA